MKLAGNGFYTFLVGQDATKPEVSKAVSEKFKVDILSVKMMTVKGETKMQRRVRKFYQTKNTKKAVVQVKAGQTIPVFETPKEEPEAIVTTADQEPQVLKDKRNLLSRTKVKVERSATGAAPTTQRKVITGK